MRILSSLFASLALVAGASAGEWQVLFDGKSMDGWKVSENPDSVQLVDGNMVLHGKRAHAFYMGKVNGGTFKNFEAEVEFLTKPKSNAGFFFHTRYQENGWPSVGYESQINATHKDWRKTASIYSFNDLKDPGHKDDVWVTKRLKVTGKRIQTWIDGKQVQDWTEPGDHKEKTKRLNEGTFAFQAHDPISKVLVRSVKVKVLP